MKSLVFVVALLVAGTGLFAQKPSTTPKDSTTNRSLAEKQIDLLHNGTLVVRLKWNERSIQAYRNAGQTKLADKLENEQRERNLHLMRAFLMQFDFCDVLFIKANDAKLLQAGNQAVFLNGRLEVDTNIKLTRPGYLYAEYGTLRTNERVNEYKYDVKHTKESNTPSTSAALIILDTGLAQLQEPFPFYTVAYASGTSNPDATQATEARSATLNDNKKGNIDDNNGRIPFDKAVARLSRMLGNFYYKVQYRNANASNEPSAIRNEGQQQSYRAKNLQLIGEELNKLNAGKETFYIR